MVLGIQASKEEFDASGFTCSVPSPNVDLFLDCILLLVGIFLPEILLVWVWGVP